MKLVRIFNGIQYGIRYKEDTKADAKRTAKALRKDGINVRIVYSKEDKKYNIYCRERK